MYNSIINNEKSPLSHYDLVFIDPVETGFSRSYCHEADNIFFSVSGDARIVAAAIKLWTTQHYRENHPKFIVGESYGTIRAVKVITDNSYMIKIDGLILIGMVGDMEPDIMASVSLLPTIACSSLYHIYTGGDITSLDSFYQAMKGYALGQYKAMLTKWDELSNCERRKEIKNLSHLVGLDTEKLYAKRGRINKVSYMFDFVDGYRLGSLDSRVKTPLVPYFDTNSPLLTDPSFGIYRFIKNEKNIRPSMFGKISNPYIRKYYNEALGINTDDCYYSINLSLNEEWDYEGMQIGENMKDLYPNISIYARAHPDFSILLISGYYVLTTPTLAAELSLEKAKFPEKQLSILNLPGPHAVYDDPDTLKPFLNGIHSFIKKSIANNRNY